MYFPKNRLQICRVQGRTAILIAVAVFGCSIPKCSGYVLMVAPWNPRQWLFFGTAQELRYDMVALTGLAFFIMDEEAGLADEVVVIFGDSEIVVDRFFICDRCNACDLTPVAIGGLKQIAYHYFSRFHPGADGIAAVADHRLGAPASFASSLIETGHSPEAHLRHRAYSPRNRFRRPAHRDKAAMNGAQLFKTEGQSSGPMTGPPAYGATWSGSALAVGNCACRIPATVGAICRMSIWPRSR